MSSVGAPTPADPTAATRIILVRHGQTEWSLSGQHTGRTDLELTNEGEAQARASRPVIEALLQGTPPGLVVSSPRIRARRTAELAGYPAELIDDGAAEWDYGDYEGLTTPEIQQSAPGWSIWDSPVPNGESAADVTTRIDALLARIADRPGPILIFSHGHASRCIGARWLQQPVSTGRFLMLGTGAVCSLGYERHTPAINHWNVDAAIVGTA